MSTVVGIGTDISSVARFRSARHPERIAAFYLTPREWEGMKDSSDLSSALATRFAAKEAVLKAAPDRINLLDFEITKDGEKPSVAWRGAPIPYSFLLTVSHEKEYVTATALCMSS